MNINRARAPRLLTDAIAICGEYNGRKFLSPKMAAIDIAVLLVFVLTLI